MGCFNRSGQRHGEAVADPEHRATGCAGPPMLPPWRLMRTAQSEASFGPPRVDGPGFTGCVGRHLSGPGEPPGVVHHAVGGGRPLRHQVMAVADHAV